ncbi:MAG: dipeptidase PepE [Flavisolibacter sp.]
MTSKNILAFSSSRVGNSGYLEKAAPVINEFIGGKSASLRGGRVNIAFLGFADVNKKYDDYAAQVQNALKNLNVTVHVVAASKATSVIENADAIMVGGGNTFKLIHDLYKLNLLPLIREKVNNGTLYIGWSAGSNILAPSIATTNDMPVIEPQSFKALGVFPFQINPHYFNQKIDGFNGESRDDRLVEFVKLNPNTCVVGLPEGSYLKMANNDLKYFGEVDGVIFTSDANPEGFLKKQITPGEDISFLL